MKLELMEFIAFIEFELFRFAQVSTSSMDTNRLFSRCVGHAKMSDRVISYVNLIQRSCHNAFSVEFNFRLVISSTSRSAHLFFCTFHFNYDAFQILMVFFSLFSPQRIYYHLAGANNILLFRLKWFLLVHFNFDRASWDLATMTIILYFCVEFIYHNSCYKRANDSLARTLPTYANSFRARQNYYYRFSYFKCSFLLFAAVVVVCVVDSVRLRTIRQKAHQLSNEMEWNFNHTKNRIAHTHVYKTGDHRFT